MNEGEKILKGNVGWSVKYKCEIEKLKVFFVNANSDVSNTAK